MPPRWSRGGTFSLLLAGIAVSFLFSSLTPIVQDTGNYADTFRMARWTMGSVQAALFGALWTTLPALLFILAAAVFCEPERDLFLCGEEPAESRGASMRRLRRDKGPCLNHFKRRLSAVCMGRVLT